MSGYVASAVNGPSAAFFDLDRTLIAGSSAFTLALAARAMKMMPSHELVRDALTAATFKFRGDHGRHAEGGPSASDDARDRILGFIGGQRQDDLAALNERVLPVLLGKIRPEARRLVDIHRHAGRATYIVSAAPQEIVEPLARSLGMTGAIGTKGEVVDGVYTGELDGPFVYAEGKVAAIEQLARWEGLDLHQCYAYSDSASDLPMLTAVGHPVAVNPDGKLERHARTHGWPVVIFSERTKTVIRRTATGVASAAVATGTFLAGLELGTRRSHRSLFGRG
jgi:HAD superfamily hydrolase (TIGR01490 family)